MLLHMSFFCLLWMPVFYLFWRAVTGSDTAAGGFLAIILGSIAALIQFFLGPLVDPGGFGISRWVSACIDIVCLPALLPLLVYLILVAFRIITGAIDFANFALLWLIPGAAVRALGWSSQNDPIFLVLVPILWTAVAAGVPFFIDIILNRRRLAAIPASLGILVVPFAAASSWWAFYSHRSALGCLFLAAAALPLLVSMLLSFFRGEA